MSTNVVRTTGSWFIKQFQDWRRRRAEDRRRPWRTLVNPKLQIKLGFYYSFIAISALTCVALVGGAFFFALVSSPSTLGPNSTLQGLLAEIIYKHHIWLISGVGIFGFFALLFSIRIFHKVAGPAYAIGRHLDALLEGDYQRKIYLRQGDEFDFIATKLNKLTERLNEEKTQ